MSLRFGPIRGFHRNALQFQTGSRLSQFYEAEESVPMSEKIKVEIIQPSKQDGKDQNCSKHLWPLDLNLQLFKFILISLSESALSGANVLMLLKIGKESFILTCVLRLSKNSLGFQKNPKKYCDLCFQTWNIPHAIIYCFE